MDELTRYRKGIARLVGASIGLDPRQPREMLAQSRLAFAESEVMALPEMFSAAADVDLDVESDTFGERSFMLGYDSLGSRPLGFG